MSISEIDQTESDYKIKIMPKKWWEFWKNEPYYHPVICLFQNLPVPAMDRILDYLSIYELLVLIDLPKDEFPDPYRTFVHQHHRWKRDFIKQWGVYFQWSLTNPKDLPTDDQLAPESWLSLYRTFQTYTFKSNSCPDCDQLKFDSYDFSQAWKIYLNESDKKQNICPKYFQNFGGHDFWLTSRQGWGDKGWLYIRSCQRVYFLFRFVNHHPYLNDRLGQLIGQEIIYQSISE